LMLAINIPMQKFRLIGNFLTNLYFKQFFIMNELNVNLESNFKSMDLKEFRENGYLQELNRRFLHPLGLSLALSFDENGDYEIYGILDGRNKPEGFHMDYKNSDEFEKIQQLSKEEFIEKEIQSRKEIREKILGYFTEPIN
jgi:hypothetical protein